MADTEERREISVSEGKAVGGKLSQETPRRQLMRQILGKTRGKRGGDGRQI